MARKRRRSRKKRTPQGGPVTTPAVVRQPGRTAKKMRPKIRLRVAPTKTPPVAEAKAIPDRRADLGSRQPVFQPLVIPESGGEPARWDERPSAIPAGSSGRRMVALGLGLVMVTSLVAGVAIFPQRGPAPPPVPKAPLAMLESFDRFLRAPTVAAKLDHTWSPEVVRPQMDRFYRGEPILPRWLGPRSLTEMRHRWDVAADDSSGVLTLWPRASFPVSVRVHGMPHEARFDWCSLVGMGEERLDVFFAQRPQDPVVLAGAVRPLRGERQSWDMDPATHARVQVSDLEGVVRGVVYLPRPQYAWIQEQWEKEETESARVMFAAAYRQGLRPYRRVPVITEWVADHWHTPVPPVEP